MGDAASCAKANQKVPQGFYNIELMLTIALRHGAGVGVCGTCMDARGIAESELTEGAGRSTLEALTEHELMEIDASTRLGNASMTRDCRG